MESNGNATFYFKCVLLGEAGVGKTSLLNRLATGKFLNSPLTTLTTPSLLTTVTLTSGVVASVDLWDTAGQERYRSLTSSYYRNTKAVLLVYDAERKLKLTDWLIELQYHITRKDALVFLVGTKLDLGTDVTLTEQEMENLACVGGSVLGIEDHLVVSSKTGHNVDNCIRRVAERVWQAARKNQVDMTRRNSEVVLDNTVKTRGTVRSKCCS